MWTRRSTPASGRPTPTVEPLASSTLSTAAESGTGIVGTFVGATIFLIFLLFAVQVLVRLYATSVLTAVAFDAAQQVATSQGDVGSEIPVAEASARQHLGSFGAAHTTFAWEEVDARRVVLEVRAESPGFVPLPAADRQSDRTVTIRTERFR